MASLFSFNNPVFTQFAVYGSIVVGKLILMSPLTSFLRIKNQAFANQEDLKLGDPGLKINTNNSTVERIRRCHQNDLENIVPFILIGGLFVLIGPDVWTATKVFQVFAASRFLHSVAYLIPLPQPSRALCFGVGCSVNIYMMARVFLYATSM